MNEFSRIAKETALAAGEILIKYWGNLSNIQEKKYSWDLVTEADQESEKLIIENISKHFPAHSILCEESGLNKEDDSEFLWIVDPVDGTTNYTHQYPMVAVAMALLQKGDPILGIVYNPILKEFFFAEKGKGAFLNDQKIQVSKSEKLNYSLLGTGFAYDRRETKDNNYAEFCHMTNTCQGVRRSGSAALDLAYVANGRLDGFWERGLNPWDIAAGWILITEAGGKVTSYEGDPLILKSGRILASNSIIHEQMIVELKRVKDEKIQIF